MSVERAPLWKVVCNKCGLGGPWCEMSPRELRSLMAQQGWQNVSEADICKACSNEARSHQEPS